MIKKQGLVLTIILIFMCFFGVCLLPCAPLPLRRMGTIVHFALKLYSPHLPKCFCTCGIALYMDKAIHRHQTMYILKRVLYMEILSSIMYQAVSQTRRSCDVMVIIQDFESCYPSSILGKTFNGWFRSTSFVFFIFVDVGHVIQKCLFLCWIRKGTSR